MIILTIYQAVINSSFIIITEFITQTGIAFYGEIPTVQIQLTEIAELYLQLWENDNFTVRVPPEKWIFFDTLPDVKIKTVKIYPLRFSDEKIIDDIFARIKTDGIHFPANVLGIQFLLFGKQ